jgi:hypothetical protein
MTETTIAERTRETIARVLGRDTVQDSDRLCDLNMGFLIQQQDLTHELRMSNMQNGVRWPDCDEVEACATVGDVVALMEKKANE